MQKTLFVLGATGFIGTHFVKNAVAAGLQVQALIRTEGQRAALEALGARCVLGNAQQPAAWIEQVAGAAILIDLVQPALPKRLTLAAIQQVASQRLVMTAAMVEALRTLPAAHRPLWLSASGVDDLTPDADGMVRSSSALSAALRGFAHIGVPIRRLMERHAPEIPCAFVYLGTVYGPGKAFADDLFPALQQGRLRLPGRGHNRMAVIHVEDAAAGLVALCARPRAALVQQSFVLTDGHPVTVRDFFGSAAAAMGAPPPRFVPRWIAQLVVGRILVETVTRDAPTVPYFATHEMPETPATGPGLRLKYPSYREGLPATLEALGYSAPRLTE